MTDDLDIRIETGKEQDKKRSASAIIFQPIGFIANAAKKVIVDNAINRTVTAVKTGVQALDDLAFDNKPKNEKEYFIAKKYKEYFDKYDSKIFSCRILTGKTMNNIRILIH